METTQQLTHWKKAFNPDFLGSHDFQRGEEKTVKITGFKTDHQIKGNGGKLESVTILEIEGYKPMILNRTNSKTIKKALKSPYFEEWVGNSITLYVQPNVKAFGDIVDAVRVRPVAPKTSLPGIAPDNFERMLAAIAAGTYTKEAAIASFSFTPEQTNRL